MKYRVIDWAGNVCFQGDEFQSFDDAEEFLSLKLDDDYDDARGEYYIVQCNIRHAQYLDPNDPRAGYRIGNES